MPTMNAKNLFVTQAPIDLGLGDGLRNQMEATALELKKKKQGQQTGIALAPTMLGLPGADYGGTGG